MSVIAVPTVASPPAAFSPHSTLNAQQIAILKSSFQLGILSEEEYNAKVTQWNVTEEHDPLAVHSVRASGWQTLGRYTTYKSALAAVRADEYGPVQWAKSTGNPADRRFVCIAHTACTAPLRIWLEKKSGEYLVQNDQGVQHSVLAASKRRKNSVLTFEQEKEGCAMLQNGIVHISCAYHMHIIHISYIYHMRIICATRTYISHISYMYHTHIMHVSSDHT